MISTNIRQFYNPTFVVSEEYRESLPDMQNGSASQIEGANVPIQQVGISGFKIPLRYQVSSGEIVTLETVVEGYVGLQANKKGINMSRIMRTFYTFKDDTFSPDKLEEILLAYKRDLESDTAFLKISFNYPMEQTSLRSGLTGYQYYRVSFEGKIDENNRYTMFTHFDFEYSSACPCSFELAEHARATRGIAAIPHSQRSIANISVQFNKTVPLNELILSVKQALKTETQVMVKREDEQAFAEMNGAYQKFVEDAARLIYEELNKDERIHDFVVRCAHLESLHSHDAVSRICKGVPGGLR